MPADRRSCLKHKSINVAKYNVVENKCTYRELIILVLVVCLFLNANAARRDSTATQNFEIALFHYKYGNYFGH